MFSQAVRSRQCARCAFTRSRRRAFHAAAAGGKLGALPDSRARGLPATHVMTRKLLIAFGVLLGLLVLGLAALVAFVDVNQYKPQLVQLVQDRYQRRLTVDGELSLALFPRLGVALPRTALSERGGDAPFASLDGARVSVALLPLLAGRIEADRLHIDGLKAAIERRADGSTSIDDLLGDGKDAEAASDARAAEAGAVPQFDIGGIELRGAELTYRDLAADNTVTLSQLTLTTGRLATRGRTPIEIDTRFSATQPAVQGELRARGEADLDLAARAYGARGLDLAVQATLAQRALEFSGKAAELRFDGASGALVVDGLTANGRGTLGELQLTEAALELPSLDWDPARRRLAVGGLRLNASGRLGAGEDAAGFEATLAAPDLALTQDAASGERISASVKLGGAQPLAAALLIENIAGSARQLKAAKFALDAELTQPLGGGRQRKLVAALGGPLTANVDALSLALPQLDGTLAMDDPALPQKAVKLPLAGSAAFDAEKKTADLRLDSTFDETKLGIVLGVRSFSPLRLAFEADADKLDLDRYFPPAQAAPAAAGPGRGGAAPREDAKREDARIDLSALKELALSGELRVGQLRARGVRTQNLRVALKAAGGRLDVAPISAALYGGSVQARAWAQADNRLGLQATLTGVSVGPLLKDALDRDLLEGRGNVKLDLATGGGTVDALKRALGGSGSLALRDGAVKGVNVAQTLRNARSFLSAMSATSANSSQTETSTGSVAEKTDFSELSASFTVKDGVAHSSDLDLKSPLLRVGGEGRVDLAAGTLDYTLRASVVGTLKGQDGRELPELRGVTVPVKLSGPFERIGYSVAWGEVARDALKSRVAGQLKEKLAPQADEEKKKLEERARDALKGLFGR